MIVVMLHMPVEGAAAERMIQAFHQRNREVDQMPGFRGFQLLRDEAQSELVTVTQWDSREDFERWRSSQEMARAHTGGPGGAGQPRLVIYEVVAD